MSHDTYNIAIHEIAPTWQGTSVILTQQIKSGMYIAI